MWNCIPCVWPWVLVETMLYCFVFGKHPNIRFSRVLYMQWLCSCYWRSLNICTNLMQVCKHFLEAVEKKQYGWFWVCPNGGKDCHYRHALPPGYVLKSQMKALLEEEGEKMSIEEEIEQEVDSDFLPDHSFNGL